MGSSRPSDVAPRGSALTKSLKVQLHERLASWAKDDKASLNALVVEILQKAFTDHVSDEEAGKPVLARLR
jgi:hypothetical protein